MMTPYETKELSKIQTAENEKMGMGIAAVAILVAGITLYFTLKGK